MIAFPLRFQRRFPLFDFHRNVSVHDQTLIGFDAEFGKNFVAEPRLVDQAEIGIFGFLMGSLVGDQIAFKRGDAILSKERGFRATPEVPE